MSSIIPIIVATVIVPFLLGLFGFTKHKENEKLLNKKRESVRTRPPILLSVFCFLVVAFFLMFCIGACLSSDDAKYRLTSIIVCGSFILAALSLDAFIRFNHAIADDEKIIVCRLFRKKKCYYYHEITYFKDSNCIMVDDLICYDSDRKKIFTVQTIQAGVPLVVQKLRQHEVKELMDFRKNKL